MARTGAFCPLSGRLLYLDTCEDDVVGRGRAIRPRQRQALPRQWVVEADLDAIRPRRRVGRDGDGVFIDDDLAHVDSAGERDAGTVKRAGLGRSARRCAKRIVATQDQGAKYGSLYSLLERFILASSCWDHYHYFMLKLIFLTGFLFPAFAGSFSPMVAKYDFQESSEFKALLANLKTLGSFMEKSASPVDYPQQMSKGERAVEEAKARNRAIPTSPLGSRLPVKVLTVLPLGVMVTCSVQYPGNSG